MTLKVWDILYNDFVTISDFCNYKLLISWKSIVEIRASVLDYGLGTSHLLPLFKYLSLTGK